MALILPKSIYLHAPKTAGMWIRAAIARAGIKTFEYGEQHSYFPELFRYATRSFYQRKLVFTFIRHPVTWYQSRWAFRMKTGWQMQHPLDWHCASNDFCRFVENCLNYRPGWATWEYNNYIHGAPGLVRHVGRQESVVDDLITILREAGEEFDEALLKTTPRLNDSDISGLRSGDLARYTPELLDRVLLAEQETIRRYYQNYLIDPNSLCRWHRL